jgi:isopenicillin-N N-acyltransferase-like protein
MQAFPRVEIAGPPRERGRAYGNAAGERIARSADLYRGEMERRGVSWPQQQQLATDYLPAIAAFDHDYLEEINGIAEGSGIPLASIVTINMRSEMVYSGQHTGAPRTPDDGCTGVIAMPEATASGRLLHAHNWDWRPQCIDTGIVLCIRRDDGPDVLTFVEAGGLGRLGFNANGLSLTGNYLQSDRDFKAPGAPLSLIRRRMLEARSLADAMKVVWSQPLLCSNNLMMGHAQGEAIDLECAPDEIFWLQPEGGLLVHTNHFVSPTARAKLRDIGVATNADSLYRERRVREILTPKIGGIDIDDLKNALADEFGKPHSVLFFPSPAGHGSYCTTVATTIIDAAQQRMWICRAPCENREFVEYTL